MSFVHRCTPSFPCIAVRQRTSDGCHAQVFQELKSKSLRTPANKYRDACESGRFCWVSGCPWPALELVVERMLVCCRCCSFHSRLSHQVSSRSCLFMELQSLLSHAFSKGKTLRGHLAFSIKRMRLNVDNAFEPEEKENKLKV